MAEVLKVENPKYQTMREIAENYWGNWLLMSHITENPRGGIVEYYYPTREDRLWNIIMEMDKDYNTYGECNIRYVGPHKNSLGGLGL
jgi:hypothetical protein